MSPVMETNMASLYKMSRGLKKRSTASKTITKANMSNIRPLLKPDNESI
jgi:hypothetical protein